MVPVPADAVLLWKRKGAGQDRSSSPSEAPAETAAQAMDPMRASPGLAQSAAATLGAPDRLPPPSEVANYSHELRLLSGPYGALENAGTDRDRARALVEYGNGLTALSRDGAAARAYLEALELEPQLQAAWNNLGSLLRRQGHLELAGSVFRSILAEDPVAGLAWFNLAMTLDMLNDWDGSDHAYVQALTYSPELWVATQNPLIVGNRRAQQALHRRYLARNGRGSIYLDEAR
jgi:tetratricopeptide (TPR) repeat protein